MYICMYTYIYIYIYVYIYIERERYIHIHMFFESEEFYFVHAVSLTGKLIGAGSGRVYSGRCRQPPRLAQVSFRVSTRRI